MLIFFSSIGFGHISAARAIERAIHAQDAGTRVVLKDIRDFMPPLYRQIDERLYWFVASHLPETFDSLFRALQARGNSVPSLARLPSDYAEDEVLAYLKSVSPDAILSTHYGAAQLLGSLRQRGELVRTRIGWLHTDYFEGYFPRISKTIDKTFLAHPALAERWRLAGVRDERIAVSGMPVSAASEDSIAPAALLERWGLAPDIPTVLIAGGKQGVGDFAAMARSLAAHCAAPLQIVAVCGTNQGQHDRLCALARQLPPGVRLQPVGLLPHAELIAGMRAADVLVTKAGGLTPAEAFAIGVPTVLTDAIAGHERQNALLFQRNGLAELALTPDEVGALAAQLLADAAKRDAMLAAQRRLQESADIGSIARFALDDRFVPDPTPDDLGTVGGTPVGNVDEALAQLDERAPAELELLLSFSTSQTPQRVVLENPFGHIAIRIGPTVYSANHIAKPGSNPNLLQHMGLADFLYGVGGAAGAQVHTNTYGMAYGRETVGLRVAGLAPTRLDAMAAEARRIEAGFLAGSVQWHRSRYNCADAVAQIMEAGGFACRGWLARAGLPAMPLDLFERAQALFERETGLRQELVAYRLVAGSQASYRFTRFPLSITQPLRSIARTLRDNAAGGSERAEQIQLTSYLGENRLQLEPLRGGETASGVAETRPQAWPALDLEDALLADIRRLLAEMAATPQRALERWDGRTDWQALRRRIDRSFQLARVATEQAESAALRTTAARLRGSFDRMLAVYGAIGRDALDLAAVRQYLKRLRAFEAELADELTRTRSKAAKRLHVALGRLPRRLRALWAR